MSKATFHEDRVKSLTAEILGRKSELVPYLDGMEPFLDRLRKLPDHSRLNVETLHLIAYEKSNRKAGLVKNNAPDVLERVTELAFSIEDDIKPLQLLCVLDGVDVPTASAILSWMFPDRWPVIDQRAWRTLYEAGVVTTRKNGIGLGGSQWRVYLQAVRSLMNSLGDLAPIPQRVDRLLYGLDVLKNGSANQ